MMDYEKLYHNAFNAMTDAERLIEKAVAILRSIQQECEILYIMADDASAADTEGDGRC